MGIIQYWAKIMVQEIERVLGGGMCLSRWKWVNSLHPGPGRTCLACGWELTHCTEWGRVEGKATEWPGQLCFFSGGVVIGPAWRGRGAPAALGREEKVLWRARNNTHLHRGHIWLQSRPLRRLPKNLKVGQAWDGFSPSVFRVPRTGRKWRFKSNLGSLSQANLCEEVGWKS